MGKRSVMEFPAANPPEYIDMVARNFLTGANFSFVQHKGEYAWRKGTGFLTAPQFVKIACVNGVVRIEAWLKGPFGGEMGLEGFYGAIPKSMLKSTVDSLIQWINAPASQPQQAPPISAETGR